MATPATKAAAHRPVAASRVGAVVVASVIVEGHACGGEPAVFGKGLGGLPHSLATPAFAFLAGALSSSRPSALPLPAARGWTSLIIPTVQEDTGAPCTHTQNTRPPPTDVGRRLLPARMRRHRPPPRPSMRAGVSLTGRVRTVGVPGWARVR